MLGTLVPPGGASLTFHRRHRARADRARNPDAPQLFIRTPDHREEAEIVDVLASAPPSAVVSINAGFSFFGRGAALSISCCAVSVRARYTLRERDGRFDVLVRPRRRTAADAGDARRETERVLAGSRSAHSRTRLPSRSSSRPATIRSCGGRR
jgi:hypothetical protein